METMTRKVKRVIMMKLVAAGQGRRGNGRQMETLVVQTANDTVPMTTTVMTPLMMTIKITMIKIATDMLTPITMKNQLMTKMMSMTITTTTRRLKTRVTST